MIFKLFLEYLNKIYCFSLCLCLSTPQKIIICKTDSSLDVDILKADITEERVLGRVDLLCD